MPGVDGINGERLISTGALDLGQRSLGTPPPKQHFALRGAAVFLSVVSCGELF